MKIAVVGCTHTGTAAVKNMAALYPNTDMTVDELSFSDFFFQPHYNNLWNFLNQAGTAV